MITRLEATRYRCFDRLAVDVGDFRVLVGANGSGKTTLLDLPGLFGDLLDADAWTISSPIARDGGWLGGEFRQVLEGNAVVDREGVVRNILRSNHDYLAAVATASNDGAAGSGRGNDGRARLDRNRVDRGDSRAADSISGEGRQMVAGSVFSNSGMSLKERRSG